jgi:predicted ATP-dependent serine protease
MGRYATMIVCGEPGSGKTTGMLMLAKHLAEKHGKALYITNEEFESPTFQIKLDNFIRPIPPRLFVDGAIGDNNLNDYDFVFIDSASSMGMSFETFDQMRKQHPKVFFVVLLQMTKDEKFLGSKKWEHVYDTFCRVENGIIKTTKNRFAPLGATKIF